MFWQERFDVAVHNCHVVKHVVWTAELLAALHTPAAVVHSLRLELGHALDVMLVHPRPALHRGPEPAPETSEPVRRYRGRLGGWRGGFLAAGWLGGWEHGWLDCLRFCVAGQRGAGNAILRIQQTLNLAVVICIMGDSFVWNNKVSLANLALGPISEFCYNFLSEMFDSVVAVHFHPSFETGLELAASEAAFEFVWYIGRS